MSLLSPFNPDGTVKRCGVRYTEENEPPSDADMLNWLERHPEIEISHNEGNSQWYVRQEEVNGSGFWAMTVRGCLEMAMRRLS